MDESKIVVTEEGYIGRCLCLWRSGVPCLNKATWHVSNTTNEGESWMCDVHKEDFQLVYPGAYVHYEVIAEKEKGER